MNGFFETTLLFESYGTEHISVLLIFVVVVIVLDHFLKSKTIEYQRTILLYLAILLSGMQLAKIPLNLFTNTFDVTKDIPLHMCNFLPFVMVWIYKSRSRKIWSAVFFWVVLGVSQANLTPSVEFSLFHYDAIRYWFVHLFLIVLAMYPAVRWGWEINLKDIWRSILALNVIALFTYGINLMLNSNYLYVMDKPPGTTFYSILPEWPLYILFIEGIIVIWSLMVLGIFKWIKKEAAKQVISQGD